MKKILTFLLITIIAVFFQGCGSKQLNERMVIQGIGIDYDDEYVVTVMYMNTDSTNQDEVFNTAKAKGKTITDAVTNIVAENGLEPLYSHNGFIIFGESMCKKGLTEPLEFFAGYYQCRPSVSVVVSKNNASDIMLADGVTPSQLRAIAESKNTTGRTMTMPMYKLMSDIINPITSACTGMIDIDDDRPVAGGIAVFDKDKLYYTLDSNDTMGIMLARGESDISAEVIPLDNKNKSFSFTHESTDVSIAVKNKRLYCNVDIKGKATVYEYTTDNSKAEKVIEKRVNEMVYNTLKKCFSKKSDLLNLGRKLRFENIKTYSDIDDWGNLLKNCSFSVNSDITLQ